MLIDGKRRPDHRSAPLSSWTWLAQSTRRGRKKLSSRTWSGNSLGCDMNRGAWARLPRSQMNGIRSPERFWIQFRMTIPTLRYIAQMNHLSIMSTEPTRFRTDARGRASS